MGEFDTIMLVAAILWSILIAYVVYLDSKVRKLEKRIK
ncbi:MAG: CcmD family protein [Candidatus Hydrothermarchaeales archaeon]